MASYHLVSVVQRVVQRSRPAELDAATSSLGEPGREDTSLEG